MPDLVLKSSGSAFENFFVDEFTTLTRTCLRTQDCACRALTAFLKLAVADRILSTSVEYDYTFLIPGYITIDGLGKLGEECKFKAVAESAKAITLELFATDESASVQVRGHGRRGWAAAWRGD